MQVYIDLILLSHSFHDETLYGVPIHHSARNHIIVDT